MKRAILVSLDRARELPELFDHCLPSLQRYADLVQADLMVKWNSQTSGCLGKYSLVREAVRAGYDRVLQLDADVFIHTEEDIFQAAAASEFALRLTAINLGEKVWFGGWRGDWSRNSGVIVARPQLLLAFLEFAELHRNKFWGDEALLNPFVEFSQLKVDQLPPQFNEWASPDNRVMHPGWHGFAHFSGDQKLERWNWFEQALLRHGQPRKQEASYA